MRAIAWCVLLTACGGGHSGAPTHDATTVDTASLDAPACQPLGAIGSFYRRTPNPRMISGHTFTDGLLDISIADPDLHWDETSATWQLYYAAGHAMTYASPSTSVIRHATSADLASWTIQDAPALSASSDAAAWDHLTSETPSVAVNPSAAADHRYLMVYSGKHGTFGYPGYAFGDYQIGAAFSADGVTYTRVAAADSPHGKDGLVLTAADVFPSATGGIVADPEVVYVAATNTYHLWFSSFACTGTTCATISAYGISHATSSDGIHWTTQEAPIRTLLRTATDPTTGGGQPSVIYDAVHCRWEMWLHSDLANDTSAQPIVFNNMAGVWHATSLDGATWSVQYTGARDLEWMQSASGEHLGLLTGADVAAQGNARYMVYSGFDDQNVPTGFYLPDRSMTGFEPGVITLNLATRDAP